MGNGSLSITSTLTCKTKSTGVGAWQYGSEEGHNNEGHDSSKKKGGEGRDQEGGVVEL